MKHGFPIMARSFCVLLTTVFLPGCGGAGSPAQPTPVIGNQSTDQPAPTTGNAQSPGDPTPVIGNQSHGSAHSYSQRQPTARAASSYRRCPPARRPGHTRQRQRAGHRNLHGHQQRRQLHLWIEGRRVGPVLGP